MVFRKLYGVFRQNKTTLLIEGWVEHSFSMGWSDKVVRAWWKNSDASHYLKKFLSDQKAYGTDSKSYRYFIVRLSRRSGNIRTNLAKGTDKFTTRNKNFYVKNA